MWEHALALHSGLLAQKKKTEMTAVQFKGNRGGV